MMVCFHDYKQREMVKSMRTKLERGFGISEDQPKSIRKARASLHDELMELKKTKKATIIWPARILADGKIVRVADPIDYFDD